MTRSSWQRTGSAKKPSGRTRPEGFGPIREIPLDRGIDRAPAGQHFAADRPDHRDAGHHDQTHDQRIFEHFAAALITDQFCKSFHVTSPLFATIFRSAKYLVV